MRKLTHVGVLQTRYCKLNLEPDYKSGRMMVFSVKF